MSTLKYYAQYEGGGVMALTVTVEGMPAPFGFTEITYSEFETYQNDIGNTDLLRNVCKDQIDAHAGDVRAKYITTVPGQESTYLMKGQEARDVKNKNYVVTLTDYPLIAAEMAARSDPSIQSTVDDILNTENLWRQLASVIEKERRLGKINVDAAVNTGDIITAKTTAISALETIRASY